ncbi:MAG TPA: Smr/MutS family protein [Stellaceae bacterium]|nr:Smr/MutS family protein [Stellaceae bacterium]
MGRRRTAQSDEIALWQAAMRGVSRLHPPAETSPEIDPPEMTAAPQAPPSAKPSTPALPLEKSAGIDRRTLERLRRGQLPIEARLDLHGLTQEEAHDALGAFLARVHGAGLRTVLVITGKGRMGAGVLRAAVPRWLNEAPNRARILAIAHAVPRDGGDGALYLLLKRQRLSTPDR